MRSLQRPGDAVRRLYPQTDARCRSDKLPDLLASAVLEMPRAIRNQLMSLEDAYDTLDDLLCDFRNEMLRRHNRTLSPERWIAEFAAWLPTGIKFAEMHAETIKLLERSANAAELDHQ